MTLLKKTMLLLTPLVGCFLVLFSHLSYAQDYSKSYRYGGRINVPVPNPPAEREIIDARIGVEAQPILGCDGFSLDALVDQQIGGLGVSDLSKELADAAKTALFREGITRVLANPQVASVLENMQGFAHARIALMQKRCNANEIYADVTNKRIQADAMQRCVEETGNMEACQDSDTIREFAEESIEDDKWSKSLHEQLCEGGIEEGCDWLTLIPNHKTVIGDNQAEGSVPALMNGQDISNMATGYAVDVINERVRAAEEFISVFGYAKAMQAALYNEPGMPAFIQEEVDEDGGSFDGAKLYTLYDHTSSEACRYSTEKGIRANMAPIMAPDGGGVFPISGASISDANISSLFGPRTRPCSGCSEEHAGLDLAYGSGTGVVASLKGVVRRASFGSCGGNMIVIEAENGTTVKYMHLSQFGGGISPGITVDAGMTIGSVGETGACTRGAHLHFEVWQNGMPIDPLAWLGGNDNAMARALGEEDDHGLTSVAAARSEEEPDSELVIDAHKKAAQLGARVASTVLCNINRSIHPHVFINMAVQPGTLGPYSRGALVAEETEEGEVFGALASGDKGSITHGLGKVFGHHAAISTYNATINEMTTAIATKSTGKGGMNRPLYNKSRAELGKLKFERYQLVQEYNTSCMLASRVSNMLEEREERIKNLRRSPFEMKGVKESPLKCRMFNYINDDGLDEIVKFATRTDEDVEKMRQQPN